MARELRPFVRRRPTSLDAEFTKLCDRLKFIIYERSPETYSKLAAGAFGDMATLMGYSLGIAAYAVTEHLTDEETMQAVDELMAGERESGHTD